MDVDELTHAVSVVHGGAAVGDLDVAPAPIRIEGDEEIDGAVAAILVIVALALSRAGTGWGDVPGSVEFLKRSALPTLSR